MTTRFTSYPVITCYMVAGACAYAGASNPWLFVGVPLGGLLAGWLQMREQDAAIPRAANEKPQPPAVRPCVVPPPPPPASKQDAEREKLLALLAARSRERLRDEFAMHALGGIMASTYAKNAAATIRAAAAYKQADAMLAARGAK